MTSANENPNERPHEQGDALDIDYDVVELPEQRVGYVRGTLGEAQATWGRLHEAAGAAGLLGREGVTNASILPGEALARPGPEMQYDTALILPSEVTVPDGLTEGAIPGGRYARATYRGPFERLAGAWGEFTGGWLPSSGERIGEGVAFEVYRTDGSDGSPPVTELHVPLA